MSALDHQMLFELGRIHDVEYRSAKALPQMIKADTIAAIKRVPLCHDFTGTTGHVTKVEQIFDCFGHHAGGIGGGGASDAVARAD